MKFRKAISMALAAVMTLTSLAIPSLAEADYGTVTTASDGSVTLSMGQDSITLSGGGSIMTDDTAVGAPRTERFKTDSTGQATLTLASVDLNGKGYDKVDIQVSNEKDTQVIVKVGETEVATFGNINNGDWDVYAVNTAVLTNTTVSGAVTLNITGAANTYCGNFVYVKFYNSSVPTATQAPATAEPTETPTSPTPIPEGTPIYMDESYSFEERAADLVSRMTLEEKVQQLGKDAPAIERLGVSAYGWWKECLHGVARQGVATNFPAPLSLSNTWNRDLVYSVADITSTEARAKNNRYNLSYYTPTINMARDPRWGRNEETYGEDPYLTGQLGGEFVKGMQGDDEKYTKIIATIKHYLANNNEKNRRGGSSVMNEFNLRNYYGKVFQNVTEIEMPGSVMSSYNATTVYRNGELLYNYIPSAASEYLLTDLLRRNWGFDGYVTTDCGAGEDLASRVPAYMQGILGSSDEEAGAYIAAAIMAGMDLECNLGGGNYSVRYGEDAVNLGYMTEEQLEVAIYHLFLQRFRTGEFDTTSAYRDIQKSVIEADEHVAVAEKAAEESWVLLKNDDNMLPLSSDKKNIAVVGDLADKLVLGDYAGSPTKTVTPIEGISNEFEGATVSHLGAVSDDSKLFNVKSISLVKKDGSKTKLDLTQAKGVSGMTLVDGVFKDITPTATAYFESVSFVDVASVEVEMAQGAQIGGTLNIAYGNGGPTEAVIASQATADTNTYVVCTGAYTGEDGGNNGVNDLYISASAKSEAFSVEAYKSQLDAADVIIAYAGTIPKQEGFGESDSAESNDREDINLPSHQSHVQEIANAYPDKTVVVMSTVGQINVEPFMDKCKAILWTSYNGQTQGTALGKVLNGEVNPSGKLTSTWYNNADLQKFTLANGTKSTIDGITGYYTNYDIQPTDTTPGQTYQYYTGTPIYPFGYGLSYTTYEYSNMTIDKTDVDANDTVKFSIDIKNTGTVAGDEVVELYVSHPQTDANMPDKQLKGFEKISLEPDETKTVEFTLNIDDLALYQESVIENVVTEGEYTAFIGKNAADTANSVKFNVTGELDATLKTVKAMPDGVTVNGAVCEDGTELESVTQIDSKVTAIMSNEDWVKLNDADVTIGGVVEVEPIDNGVISYADGKATITYTEDTSAKLIHAVYNGTVLSGVDVKDVTLTANKAVTVDVTLSNGDKLMLWDSMEGMKPLCGVLTTNTTAKADGVSIVYSSSDEDIAVIDEDGIVISGSKEGVATITIEITIDGVTKSDSYPVVNKLAIKPSAEDKGQAKADLKAAYDKLPQTAYSDTNLAQINDIYTDAIKAIDAVTVKTELATVLAKAINDLNSVAMDNLEEKYIITSVNPKFIEKGTIDYREGGIEMYDGATGTVTNSSPYTDIALQAADADGNVIDSSKIVWQIKKFDDSVRKVADIDENGNLTVYGNGIVQITAADIENMTCGKLMVHINMQIEGEYADNANGADLTDAQKGTSGGLDAGSTADVWMEYKSVKLSNLDSIVARVAGKNDGAVYVSLDKSAAADKVVASANVNATGGWSTWTDVTLTLKQDVINAAQLNGVLDEYGCATVYIQTNGINLDYFRLNYIENNDEIPYIIEKTLNKADGKIKVNLKYRGSTLATDVTLKAEVLNADNSVKSTATTTVKGTGEYEIETGAANGETVLISVCDSERTLSEIVTKQYLTPVDSEIVVYSLNDSAYEVLTGGTDEVAYTDTVNGLSGYGAWDIKGGASYTYLDVNEKEYKYTFAKSWQAGSGNTTKRSLYFTPKAPCKVTAVFQGSAAERSMNIYQSDDCKINQPGTGSVVGFSLEITDTTKPVYVYGGSSNKQLYAIIVEYYGSAETVEVQSVDEAIDRPVQVVDWNGSRVTLTKHDITGETKVMTENGVELATSYFAESDVAYNYDDSYTINALAVYKDRLYAACDNGLVIVFTECQKCYKLKKVCDFDIKTMSITDGVMTVSDSENTKEINMSDIGGDSITAEEAGVMLLNGAVLVDVRTAEEYAQSSAAESVNVPLDEIAKLSDMYSTEQTIIFVCSAGTRSAKAIEAAQEMGFTNLYNGGSYKNY